MASDLKLPVDGLTDDTETFGLKSYRHTRRALDNSVASLAKSILKLMTVYKHEFPPHALKRYRRELHDASQMLRTFSRYKKDLYREITGTEKPKAKSRRRSRQKSCYRSPARRCRRRCRRRSSRRKSLGRRTIIRIA